MFLKKGLMHRFRGKMLRIQSQDSCDKDGNPDDEMLGGATVIEGIVTAATLDPMNSHVLYVKKCGVPGTCELFPDSPVDVLVWIVRESNQFHKGSEMTFVEIYDQCETVQRSWEAHKMVEGISRRVCPSSGEFRYEKQYEKYVFANFAEFFPDCKWQRFDNTKSFFNEMCERKLYCKYKALAEQRCDFLASGLSNDHVIKANHDMLTMLASGT